jgi:hypothetical protein
MTNDIQIQLPSDAILKIHLGRKDSFPIAKWTSENFAEWADNNTSPTNHDLSPKLSAHGSWTVHTPSVN